MLMRKTGLPERDELVICRITKLFPNSAYATLVEYNKTGMIHVSEVAKRWVRDIREFVKEHQYVVCRVMKVEDESIQLSIKRVYREQSTSKLNEFKRERKAEKMLEMAGEKLGLNLDKSYDEIGYLLDENFGSISKALSFALKDPDLLKKKGVPDKWVKVLHEIAEKNYVEKEYSVIANLTLVSYASDGVKKIQKALSKAEEADLEVNYISAPKYTLQAKGNNIKELQARVEKVAEEITRELRKSGGNAEYSIVEN